jgi:hypothetical protein
MSLRLPGGAEFKSATLLTWPYEVGRLQMAGRIHCGGLFLPARCLYNPPAVLTFLSKSAAL